MTLGSALAAELRHEAVSTRKMLERTPDDAFAWQPHEKSMPLGTLAAHVAEVAEWVRPTLTLPELNFAVIDYKPKNLHNAAALVEAFDGSLADALPLLENVSDEDLMQSWRLRNGDRVIFELPRGAVLRTMVFSHLIHHRGQLSVYLRLKDIPLPSVYGPTADEPQF